MASLLRARHRAQTALDDGAPGHAAHNPRRTSPLGGAFAQRLRRRRLGQLGPEREVRGRRVLRGSCSGGGSLGAEVVPHAGTRVGDLCPFRGPPTPRLRTRSPPGRDARPAVSGGGPPSTAECPTEGNGEQRTAVRNVHGAFAVSRGLPGGPVLLVDDIHDSRWTLTVVGAELRSAGYGPPPVLHVAGDPGLLSTPSSYRPSQ